MLLLAGVAMMTLRAQAQEQSAPAATAQTTAPAAVQSVADDLASLSATMQNESLRQEERDEAARRLQDRHSPEALTFLHDALVSMASPGGQLAASRALSESMTSDPQFIDPLFALLQLGRNRAQTDAASAALGQYKTNRDVLNRLIELARNGSRDTVRIGAIDALGMFTDKPAAEALVRILLDDAVPEPQRVAAATALGRLTGGIEFGSDVTRWRNWWAQNSEKSATEWEQAILYQRAIRFNILSSQRDRSIPELQRILFELYRTAPESQRAEVLLRYLRSDADAIRVVGARISYEDSVNALPVPQPARDQLRTMIGDSSPNVRRDVSQAIWALADVAAVNPLRVQLRQERVPEVQIQIVQTLAKLGDISCVPDLLPLLESTSRGVAEATADALRILGGEIRDNNPALATEVAGRLRQALVASRESIGQDRFGEVVIDAMGALREESLRPVYQDLLQQRTSAPIRRAALRALGDLRDTNDADVIMASLDDSDPTIRLEAARALRWTASPQHARALYPRLQESVEPNQEVRDAIWLVLQSLFPNMSIEELEHWAQRFENDGQVDRRLAVQKAARDTLIRQGNESLLAYTRINLGATMMRTGRYSEAAVEFQQSLNYFKSQPDSMVTNQLVEQLLTARLRAEQYPEAVQFGAEMIRIREGYQEDVGPAIRKETERLIQAQEFDKAIRLIGETKKMQPALAVRFTSALDVLEKQASAQRGTSN